MRPFFETTVKRTTEHMIRNLIYWLFVVRSEKNKIKSPCDDILSKVQVAPLLSSMEVS